jgi:hypothetical protein
MRRIPSVAVSDVSDVVTAVAHSCPATVVVDVEPLIAPWKTRVLTFVEGAVAFQRAIALGAPCVSHLVFATNAVRPRPALPDVIPLHTAVITTARKPWRTDYLRGLPRPIVVVGDQPLTDGILAWRLGAIFYKYEPATPMPLWPRLQHAAGLVLGPLLFTEIRSDGKVR